jgi:hypothetical protein
VADQVESDTARARPTKVKASQARSAAKERVAVVARLAALAAVELGRRRAVAPPDLSRELLREVIFL